jgi:SAM-dependent methyltransferase
MFATQPIISALATGKSQWNTVYGKNFTHPFTAECMGPKAFSDFMLAMHLSSQLDNRALATALLGDGVTATRVLDIGGGLGSFCIELTRALPDPSEVIVYEKSDLVPIYIELFRAITDRNITLRSQVTFAPGDFLRVSSQPGLFGLEEKPHHFDLIVLGWIIHDWDDATAQQLIKRAAWHLNKSGHLVLLESILPNSRVGPQTYLDMTMLLQTEGKERTSREYDELLRGAGLRLEKIISSATRRQAIVARHE